jgi:hypothetical protein
MQPLTLGQFRAATTAGGVTSVTLKADGGAFIITIATRNGGDGLLVTTRARQPRRFTDLGKAMLLLRDLGIVTALVDATAWEPELVEGGMPRPDRAAAMKQAHEAVLHDRWFRDQVMEGLREADDPATVPIPHDQVMREMKGVIDRIAGRKTRGRAD